MDLRPSALRLNLDALEPWTDPAVWDLIAGGHARAVHHIESPAMISLCKMCNVRDIDTLIAIVSVIRPGAANECKKTEFALRSQGLSPVRYPHPSLERCLRSTYGLVVYEEHILQICEAFAGLPPGRADVLRRALGKEKMDVIAQIQGEFAESARRLGRTEAEIAEVWNLVSGFRGYAFCKAHSTAYGVEAYQSAWLKLHYPAEFMAAVLDQRQGLLLAAGLCAGMPPAGHAAAAAQRERAGAAVPRGAGENSRAGVAGQGPYPAQQGGNPARTRPWRRSPRWRISSCASSRSTRRWTR